MMNVAGEWGDGGRGGGGRGDEGGGGGGEETPNILKHDNTFLVKNNPLN